MTHQIDDKGPLPEDEFYEIHCVLCLKDGRVVIADTFCDCCHEFLCQEHARQPHQKEFSHE